MHYTTADTNSYNGHLKLWPLAIKRLPHLSVFSFQVIDCKKNRNILPYPDEFNVVDKFFVT